MSTYNPDRWLLLKLGEVQKVLAGWSGGYLDGDSWKLSSGVNNIEEDGDYWLFHNYSGSIYKCHKNAQGTTILSGAKYAEYEKHCKKAGANFETITDIKPGKVELPS